MKFERQRYTAELTQLAEANAFVEQCMASAAMPEAKQFGVLLALEEAFVNICSYAYPGGSGEVEISCGSDQDSFALEIADHGSPFDVLSLPDPDITLDIMDRPIGGLGIHFIRTLAQSVSYRRENDQNILRMAFAF